ncbi:MAG: hypothetical protein NTY77_00980 [Elusimicrobia bacterium]|nr:hypothetical protein [Elusimicrobiota bacterium]
MDTGPAQTTHRLWLCARYLPETARLLGTRYRALFLSYAPRTRPEGDAATVADALAFADFMLGQQRIALLAPELSALRRDARHLQRRYRLLRRGEAVTAVPKGKLRRWLGL